MILLRRTRCWQTGRQQSTDGLHPESLEPGPEPEPESFLNKLLKGKVKRHISNSRVVNEARRELLGTLDSREYVSASFLLLLFLKLLES